MLLEHSSSITLIGTILKEIETIIDAIYAF